MKLCFRFFLILFYIFQQNFIFELCTSFITFYHKIVVIHFRFKYVSKNISISHTFFLFISLFLEYNSQKFQMQSGQWVSNNHEQFIFCNFEFYDIFSLLNNDCVCQVLFIFHVIFLFFSMKNLKQILSASIRIFYLFLANFSNWQYCLCPVSVS